MSTDTAAHTPGHPQRYPKHADPHKGQVYGGVCNITRCDNGGATFWNMGTYGLYCASCAHAINWNPAQSPLCIEVTAKPDIGDMEQIKHANGYYGSAP